MDVGAVAVAHDGIAQGRLHAAHGRRRMGTLRRNHRKTNNLKTGLRGFHGHPFAREPRAYAKYIRLVHTHASPLSEPVRGAGAAGPERRELKK
jgi:hypothetical protein